MESRHIYSPQTRVVERVVIEGKRREARVAAATDRYGSLLAHRGTVRALHLLTVIIHPFCLR